MSRTLQRHWWAVGLRGALAIAFGIALLAFRHMALVALVLLFGVFAIADGALTIWLGRRRVQSAHQSLEGMVSLAAGAAALLWPGITGLGLLLLIALRAILTGAIEIAVAVRLRRVIGNQFLLVLGGSLSIAFGMLLIAFPGAGALALTWLIGAYTMVVGIALLALAFRLRGLAARRRALP